MILEHAPLQVNRGHADEFEAAFAQARTIVSARPGFRRSRCPAVSNVPGRVPPARRVGHSSSTTPRDFVAPTSTSSGGTRYTTSTTRFPTVEHYEPVGPRLNARATRRVTTDVPHSGPFDETAATIWFTVDPPPSQPKVVWFAAIDNRTPCRRTHQRVKMGSSDADLALIKQIQPVVSGIGTVIGGLGAILSLIGAVAAFS